MAAPKLKVEIPSLILEGKDGAQRQKILLAWTAKVEVVLDFYDVFDVVEINCVTPNPQRFASTADYLTVHPNPAKVQQMLRTMLCSPHIKKDVNLGMKLAIKSRRL